MAGTPPSKRSRIDFTDLFVLNVGDSAAPYRLPTKIFATRSNFFKAAFSSRWRTGDKPVELKDVKTADFETYIHSVIYDEIDLMDHTSRNDPPLFAMVDLYLLADRMLDSRTANLTMDSLVCAVRDMGFWPSDTLLSKMYTSTSGGNPLRKLAIDWALHE